MQQLQAMLKALSLKDCFPHYDGETNFRAFKTEFQSLADRRVSNDEEKRTYLKKSLQGKAQEYIHKYATHATTYTQMWDMLSQRYDDPMANNYTMLNKVFNTSHFNKAKSTQAHWDDAVGDIQEVIESGVTIDEILVYYRLHKFPPDVVRRVKDLHKITYPARKSINLEEAKALFNKITAEEPTLKEDSIAIEEGIKNFTFTATPMQNYKPHTYPSSTYPSYTYPSYTYPSSTSTPPIYSPSPYTPPRQPQHSGPTQSTNIDSGPNRPRGRGGFARNRGRARGGGGRGASGISNTQSQADLWCRFCGAKVGHLSGDCTKYKTFEARERRVKELRGCQLCGYGDPSHTCNSKPCPRCLGNPRHKYYLCPLYVEREGEQSYSKEKQPPGTGS